MREVGPFYLASSCLRITLVGVVVTLTWHALSKESSTVDTIVSRSTLLHDTKTHTRMLIRPRLIDNITTQWLHMAATSNKKQVKIK